MIKRLQIKNFRKHKKLDIKFSPTVNVITGRNAAGKSCLIRALRWLVMNRPSGEDVIKWGAKKASVRLTFGENKVTRTKGDGTNEYHLNDNTYKAFGTDVPAEIRKTLGLCEVNFQGQHDAPFWFCETAGEVSRQLNAIVNLEVIDNTLADIASKLKKSKMSIDIIKERLDDASEKVTELGYVETAETELEAVEKAYEKRQDVSTELTRAHELVSLVSKYRNKCFSYSELGAEGRMAIQAGDEWQDLVNSVGNLQGTVSTAIRLRKQAKATPPSILPLENRIKTLEREHNRRLSVEELLEQAKKYNRTKTETEIEVTKLKKQIQIITKGKCPICKRTLTVKSS